MKKNLIILFLILIIIPLSCQAFFLEELFSEIEEWFSRESNDSQVINEINVSTNTGNTVINGEVIEGKSKSQVYVKNIVNGKEIEPIDIESEAKEVKVKSEIKVRDKIAQIQRETEIDSERRVKNYEINLEDSGSVIDEFFPKEEEIKDKEETVEILDTIYDWWLDFVGDLKFFFRNIF